MLQDTEAIQLSASDIDYLRFIYRKKRRMWYIGLGGISGLMLRAFWTPVLAWLSWQLNPEPYKYRYAFQDKIAAVPYITGLFVLAFALTFSWLYRRKIMPLKKDITACSGLIIRKQIIRKTMIPATGRYFFYFDDLKMPYKEVTSLEYARYDTGAYFPFLVSAHSGIQVDGFGNYELL